MSRLIFLAALACAAPAFAETRFFGAIDDLPLPAGFVDAGAGASFEGAQGRIVTQFAVGDAAGLAVRDFYYDTLPQLGWAVSARDDGVLMFQRGREELTFTVERVGQRTRLGARLIVRPASMNVD